MSTRHLIAAAVLFGSAFAAQADTLPSTDSTFIASWTDSSGNDIASSGVLGNGSSLVGGVAYGNDSAAQAFAAKVSANLASGSSYTLVKGLDGEMLTMASSAQLAAMSGNGVAVVGWDDQRTVSRGQSANDLASVAIGAGAAAGTGVGAATDTGAAAGADAGSTVTAGTDVAAGAGAGAAVGAGVASPLADVPVVTAEVPEPSSIALLMAGMFGVLAIGRRRAR